MHRHASRRHGDATAQPGEIQPCRSRMRSATFPPTRRANLTLSAEHRQPIVIAELNDPQATPVQRRGHVTWDERRDTDELCIRLDGALQINFVDSAVTRRTSPDVCRAEGRAATPPAAKEVRLMLIKPRGVPYVADAGGDPRAERFVDPNARRSTGLALGVLAPAQTPPSSPEAHACQ